MLVSREKLGQWGTTDSERVDSSRGKGIDDFLVLVRIKKTDEGRLGFEERVLLAMQRWSDLRMDFSDFKPKRLSAHL